MSLAQSTNWGHFPNQIGIEKCLVFEEENQSTQRKTSQSKHKNQQQTQSTYDAESRNRTWATLVGGECSHHCAIPVPHNQAIQFYLSLQRDGHTLFLTKKSAHCKTTEDKSADLFLPWMLCTVHPLILVNLSLSITVYCFRFAKSGHYYFQNKVSREWCINQLMTQACLQKIWVLN